MSRQNLHLDQGLSDDSGAGSGYDSEAAEISRTERRGVKRRKLSHSSATSDEDGSRASSLEKGKAPSPVQEEPPFHGNEEDNDDEGRNQELDYKIKNAAAPAKKSKRDKKEKAPGVVYLSSLPPYLKPSALRNLLAQRGFEPITRLFLTPASKHKHNSKKNSRQLYTEGWIEFASKKTAKRCAEALNAQQVGGKKGGFYYDDLWNMKYLKGMAWEELMAGIVEERREAEGRRDEERRKIAAETQAYVEGVEQGKKFEGMRKKRKLKAPDHADGTDVQRSFHSEVQQVLSQIL
ncbi:RNA-binding ATPase activator esf2 [Exophiala xenobiotica]|uniref:Pre-rRNA-processing protein ESF2 n=1 Tax=Lithohypha guttulata TaxID=1690604 RepID=A0ABR0KEL6_9EURO|nr:RNA-binding ATPase activator esf2 [Lithohypha guttulata]KAK5321653.1 RNA-binding ATPase activator esf2 [Exophiala xenobiotica]